MNLPKELLYSIFEKLDHADLLKCQKVCRSWYDSAHLLLLEKVTLKNASQIEKFISSIDHNTNKSYLAAVKTIKLKSKEYTLCPENIEKLFLRFPNLERVESDDNVRLFQEFNKDTCSKLLKNCPGLETFTIYTKDAYLNDTEVDIICELKPLLTSTELDDVFRVSPETDVMQFLCSFPRLQKFSGYSQQLDTFQQLFSLLQQLPDLKSVALFKRHGGEVENFAESYLATMSKEEQDQFVTRLSKLSGLNIRYRNDFCINTVKFASKYLTGLDSFAIYSMFNEDWTAPHKQLFLDDILNLACTAKDTAEFIFGHINYRDISRYLPIIAQKILCQLPPAHKFTKKRVLRLRIEQDNIISQELVNLGVTLERFKSLRKIVVSKADLFSIADIVTGLLGTAPTINNVDKFIMGIDQYHSAVCNINTYETILYKMPSIKEAKLTIPRLYQEVELDRKFSTATYPLLEKLTLELCLEVGYQDLIDRYCAACPNLKELGLQFPSESKNLRLFKILLPEYSLKRLKLNIPLNTKVHSEAIVLEVDSNKQKYLYEISLKSLSIRQLEELNDKARLLYRFHIIITNLQQLDMCLMKQKIKIYLCGDRVPQITAK